MDAVVDDNAKGDAEYFHRGHIELGARDEQNSHGQAKWGQIDENEMKKAFKGAQANAHH